MKNNFYTHALCALLTITSISITASEVTADNVINHIATITGKNTQSIKNLNVGHAIELCKKNYQKDFQDILAAKTDPYLNNSLVNFYKRCENDNNIPGQAAKAMLENLYSHIYAKKISNAQIILTKKLNKKPLNGNKNNNNQIPISDEGLKKQQKEQDLIVAKTHEQNEKFRYDRKKQNSKFPSYIKIGSVATIALFAIGLGYYWYKK